MTPRLESNVQFMFFFQVLPLLHSQHSNLSLGLHEISQSKCSFFVNALNLHLMMEISAEYCCGTLLLP